MPLLARLVVGIAMLTSGWVNCFEQINIREGIATDLQAIDIKVQEGDTRNAEVYSTDVDEIQHTTRGVHRITWLLSERWPQLGSWAVVVGWIAGISQLLCGVLLIVGLFTRIAALVVCIACGSAVYLIAFHMHGMFTMNPFDWPHDSHRFLQVIAGLSLLTLSLGLVCSGSGSLSIDRSHRAYKEPAKNGNEE